MKGRVLAAGIAAVVATAAPSAAGASVTVGQLGSPLFPTGCGGDSSWAQPTVTSGNSFVSPVSGTITTWSVNFSPGDPARLKVWRAAGGTVLTSVGTSALGTPTGGISTFPAAIPITAGDSIGLYSPTSSNCVFSVPGERHLFLSGTLSDGVSANFTSFNDFRISIQATVEPNTGLVLGAVTRNGKKGTATIAVTVPNPGTLAVTGNGVSGEATASAAGKVSLKIKAKGKKKGKLNAKGKVAVKPTITFTPTGGQPASAGVKVTLKKR